jgi:hypothetical protein
MVAGFGGVLVLDSQLRRRSAALTCQSSAASEFVLQVEVLRDRLPGDRRSRREPARPAAGPRPGGSRWRAEYRSPAYEMRAVMC